MIYLLGIPIDRAKSGLLIKSSRFHISELRNYFTKIKLTI